MRGIDLLDKMGLIDPAYVEAADAAHPQETAPARRRWPVILAAALLALFLMGAGIAAVLYGDLWIEKPAKDPAESVRAAIENQLQKDYTEKIVIESVEVDEAETQRVVEQFIRGVIAERRGWSDEYLAEHFSVVKAVYYAEYDAAQTTRSDGSVVQYFYLTRDPETGKWSIVDNSGNLNRAESSPEESAGAEETPEPPDPPAQETAPAVPSCEEHLVAYMTDLFNDVYAPYYDGLHYEIHYANETVSENQWTAEFFWTMYFLGKGWDIESDEGVEQQANMGLQASAQINTDGTLDLSTIQIFADSSVKGPAVYDIPLEAMFPTQLAD